MQIFDTILSYLTLFSIFLALFLVISGLFVKSVSQLLAKYVVPLMLVVATAAMFGSLYYSEVLGYTPCVLCWYQRILIYPQVFLLWLALVIKDKSVVKYILFLSLLCMPLSLYHYLMQISVVPEVKCSVLGYSSSCSESFGAKFGFITIPFMAFMSVVLNFLLSLNYILFSRNNK